MGVAKEILGEAVKNVRKVGLSKGSYLQAAAKGAATMGAIGGVSEWAQGGSFVAGAKSNLVSGAALGMAGRAVNIGINGTNYGSSTLSSTYNKATGKVGSQVGVSKQVKAINRTAENVGTASKVMSPARRSSIARKKAKGIRR